MKSEAQVQSVIVAREAEIGALAAHQEQISREHQQACVNYNQASAENQAKYNQLQGELKALKEMLEPSPEVASTTTAPP